MSIILKLLGWSGLPSWALELLVMGALAGGILYWDHLKIQEGVTRQRTEDNVALQKLRQDAAKQSQVLLERAQKAEGQYAQEHQDSADYRATHPLLGAEQLCNNPHGGSPHLSAVPTLHPGDAASPAAAPVGPAVSGPDPQRPDDRLQLLSALGALCDDQSAVIREFQQRK
jgi:hypothetical protein